MPTFDLIGLSVRDMPAALAFYRQLGWDIPAAMDSEAHVEHVLPNGLRFAWDTYDVIRSFTPDWQPPPHDSHRVALAFLCETPAEVDAVHSRLIASGHHSHATPFDAFWGQRYAQVQDPDGNIIDLFAPLDNAPSETG
ncbi:MAG: VOC family protein [bacterium]|nr:VOC family protein [bacterium]